MLAKDIAMNNTLVSFVVLFAMLAFTAFLITASYYAKHKPDTKFGKISQEIDKVLKNIFTEINDLFTKKLPE